LAYHRSIGKAQTTLLDEDKNPFHNDEETTAEVD
jgi:hypothetical protein